MYDRRLVAGGAAVGLVAVAIIAFILAAPRFAMNGLNGLAQQQLGRSVIVRGGTHLDFSPLSIRLEDAVLSGVDARDDSFAMARSAIIPVTLGQLFGGTPQLSEVSLVSPEFALLINDRGVANWDFPGFTPTGTLRIRMEQGRFRYFDARNNQGMTLAQADGTLDLRADGGASFAGSAVINGRLVRIDADLKSLARVNADGSPLELALAAEAGSASFSGRLSTAQVLSLAGPVSLSGPVPGPALHLLGLALPDGAGAAGPITIDGALDSAGRAFAIRNATLSIGAFRAAGELGADLRSDQPKLQANLTADTLWLDPFVPASGAKGGDWGRVPLPFGLLKTLDIEAAIEARSMAFGSFASGPASLKATLAGGKLEVVSTERLATGGTLGFIATADATVLPPGATLKIDAADAEVQPLIAALTGASQLTGIGSFAVDVSATGTTQEELAGTLKGTASIALRDGNISGTDFTGLVLAAKQKILAGWSEAPGATPFTSLEGQATIEDGIASFRDLRIVGPVTAFTVEGLIDVLRQAVAVSVTASASGQPLLPVAVIARGPWANPQIYPDIPNILSNPEGGFSRLQDAAPLQGN
ncbi:MAG: hypothetical protein RJA94_2726 [Pseudomonadota bacterium]